MSRAIRRQQKGSQNEPSTTARRGATPRQSGRDTRGAKPPASGKRRFRLKVPSFLEEIISELKKVAWPTREETAYLTMVVIIVALAAGVVLGLVDVFFNWLIDNLLLK